MSENLKDKSINAFLWVLVDKLGSSTSNFLVSVVLARLLTPDDFGLLAMVMIFFELSTTFIHSGFSFALIREEEISEIDKSTTFVFQLVVAVFLYGVLFFTAPLISRFFDQVLLVAIIRIMGLNLIINSIGVIQQAVLTQQINFKRQTIIRFFAVIISGAIAIAMAIYGWGVWALVAKLVINELLSTILLWLASPWKMSFRFSWASFHKLFGFGSRLLAESLIDKFFRHIVQVLIGKFFSAASLGFYTQANNFCNMAANNFQQTIQKVTYPVLAKLKDDIPKLKEGYRQIIMLSSFVIVPVMILMGVLAEPLLVAMVGEKWRPSVPFLQLLCMAGITYHFSSINLNVLLVLGRVDLGLKLEVVKKVVTGIAIVIGIQFGIFGLVISQVVAFYLAVLINSYYTNIFLSYPLTQQLKDVSPTLLFGGITGAAVYGLQRQNFAGQWMVLVVAGVLSAVLYLGLHFLFRSEEFAILKRTIYPRMVKFISKS